MVFRRPNHPDIAGLAEQAYRNLEHIDDRHARANASLLLVNSMIFAGRFDRASDTLRHLSSMCEGTSLSTLSQKMRNDVESLHASYNADKDSCLRSVYDGLELEQETGVSHWSFHLLTNGVAACLGAGDLDTAQELLQKLALHEDSARRLDHCIYSYCRAWLLMLRGETLSAIQEQKRALRIASESGCPRYELMSRFALVDLELRLDNSSASMDKLASGSRRTAMVVELRRLRRLARTMGSPLIEYQGLLIQARCYFELNRHRAANTALALAFAIGRQHGLRHHLWWHPESMAELSSQALQIGVETNYARELIRQRDLAPPPQAVSLESWPWRFQIFTLGGFRLLRDGKPLSLAARLQQKPLELLKALVAFGEVNVPEAKIAVALWPRIDSECAHRSLTTTLHRLRKMLGEDQAVLLRFGRLSLNSRYCWTDIRTLDALTTAVDHELGSLGDATLGAGADRDLIATRLLDLYKGPFLRGEGKSALYAPMRQRLRNRLLRAAGELTRHWADSKQWPRSFTFLGRAIDAEPALEGLYRRLMLCYRDAGLATEAMDVYDQCREMCRAEAAGEPSRETTAVFNLVLQAL